MVRGGAGGGGARARPTSASLYRGAAPRPGPDLLYAPPAVTRPQLTNAGPWRAAPILVSGASAYRDGEFLYQDFLYDDHGARGDARSRRPAHRRRHVLGAQRHATRYPTDAALRGQRRRPRRAARQAAGRRDRVPADAQHDARPRAGGDDDRDRRLAGAAAVPARRRRHRAGAAVPDRPRRHRRPARRRDAGSPPGRRRASVDRERRQIECACRTPPGTPGAARCGSRPASGCGTRRRAYLVPAGVAHAPRAPRRRHARAGARVLQRRLPVRRAAAEGHRRQRASSRTRPGGATAPGRRARRRRPQRRSTRTSTSASSPTARRRERGVPRTGRAQPDPRQPLRAQAGHGLRPGVRQLRALRGRAAGPAAAVRAVRAGAGAGRAGATGCSCCCTRWARTTTSSPAAATSRSSASAGAATS